MRPDLNDVVDAFLERDAGMWNAFSQFDWFFSSLYNSCEEINVCFEHFMSTLIAILGRKPSMLITESYLSAHLVLQRLSNDLTRAFFPASSIDVIY